MLTPALPVALPFCFLPPPTLHLSWPFGWPRLAQLPLACLLAVGPEDVATPLRRLCLRTSLSGAAAGARALGTSGGLAPGLAGEVGQEADAAGDADTDRERQEAAWLSSLPTDEHLARRQAGVEEKGEGQVERRLGRPGLARLKLPNTPTTPITPGGREFPPPSAGGGGGAAAGGAAAGGGKRAKAEFDALTRWLRQPLLPWRQLAQCGGLALVFWLLLAALADVYLLPVSAPATGGGGGDAAQPPAACALAIAGPLFLQPPAPGSEAGAAAESLVLRLGPLELPVSLPPPAAAALAAARARLAAAGAAAAGCWAGRVYGGQVLLDDVSPNVGQWWYLAMEAFDDAKVGGEDGGGGSAGGLHLLRCWIGPLPIGERGLRRIDSGCARGLYPVA